MARNSTLKARSSTLKASDEDRERVAARLREATVEGRLLAEELEHRLGAVFSARTYGELDVLVRDLPGKRVAKRRPGGELVTLRSAALVAAAAVAAVVVIALAALAVAALLTGWIFWVVAAWIFFGRRRHGARRRGYPPRHRGGYGPRYYGTWRA